MLLCQDKLAAYRAGVKAALRRWLPDEDIEPRRLHAAMRYAALADGKRIRPILVYATGEAFGAEQGALHGPACAVELIHAYSLVHDDLPAMDDDDMRRDRPACHRAFDEATAILVGDALQSLAFQVLAEDPATPVGPERRLQMVQILSAAIGSHGMAGGQALDLAGMRQTLGREELERVHRQKTGALIRASVQLGALASGNADPGPLQAVSRYADCVGLAFQVRDDILDTEGDTGGELNASRRHTAPSYSGLLGLEGAVQVAQELYRQALEGLADFGDEANMLRGIAAYVVQRDR